MKQGSANQKTIITAANIYGLSSYIPYQIDVAIPRGKKLPKALPVSVVPHWYSEERYKTGVVQDYDLGYAKIKIYDKEKTVSDIIF